MLLFGRIRGSESALRSRYLQNAALLERVRGGIYLSGTIARDYFADPSGPDSAGLQLKLTEVEKDVKQALTEFTASKPPGDRDALRMSGEVTAYWSVLHLMSEMASKPSTAGVSAYFRRQLAARRETMLDIASDITASLDREWSRGQTELDQMHRNLRWVLIGDLIAVFALGLALAIWTIHRLSGLEEQTRALSSQLLHVQEQERRSIARELHDEIGQALSVLLLEAGGAASATGSLDVRARLTSLSSRIEALIEETRRIALSLRPSMLDDLGLVPALEWQAREVGQRTGLDVQVVAEESTSELPDAQRTCIYRIVQEALRNTVRHSGATQSRVGLEKIGGAIKLNVQDNGRGFAAGRTKGLGLLGIEERVAQLGGRFRVRSAPGAGTQLTVELPL